MTDEKKRKLYCLVSSLMQAAKDAGFSRGLDSGQKGRGYFLVPAEEAIKHSDTIVEEYFNDICDVLGMPEYKEHEFTPEEG